MAEERMLDFLGALIGAESDLAPPSVTPVRFQVRTGMIAPPKHQMRKTNYEVMIWKYGVNDLKGFAAFLAAWETPFSDEFHRRSRLAGHLDDRDISNLVISQSYLGTFPARSPAGAAINRFNTSWGGRGDRLREIEKCRLAIPSQLISPDERWLAAELDKLLQFVSGDVAVDVLDPSIGF